MLPNKNIYFRDILYNRTFIVLFTKKERFSARNFTFAAASNGLSACNISFG